MARGITWEKLDEHLFKGWREGELSTFYKGSIMQAFFVGITFISSFIFLWIAVNTEATTLGFFYSFLTIFGMVVGSVEFIFPKKAWYYSIIAVNKKTNLKQTIYYSLILTSLFFVISFLLNLAGITGTIVPQGGIINTSGVLGIIGQFLLIGFLIPIQEESTFSAILMSSIAEPSGVVMGVTLSSLAFTMFHWAIYGQAFPILVLLFTWKLLSNVFTLKQLDINSTVLSHITINVVSLVLVISSSMVI